MLAGFGVFAVGRNHPVVRQAMHDVLDLRLADLTQFDAPPLAGLLAEPLLARAPHLDRVYFSNSGTEAVEAALKFARCATGRPRIVYCEHAFHGLTVGSLSVNGADEFRAGFDPLLPDTCIPFGDLDALARELRRGDVAGLVIEPIQGKRRGRRAAGLPRRRAGIAGPARGAADRSTRSRPAWGARGTSSPTSTTASSPTSSRPRRRLSGGYIPIGATMARDWIFQKVYSSMDRVLVHDSTFGSNAQAMAAGLATLHVLDPGGPDPQRAGHRRAAHRRGWPRSSSATTWSTTSAAAA